MYFNILIVATVRKSRLTTVTRNARLTPSTVHAHLSDKLSELYHILQGIRTWIYMRERVQHTHTHTQSRSNRRKATGRLREVSRALRGIEAHRRDARRVKVAPANFIGNWANWGFQTPNPLSRYFRLELPSRKGLTFEHKINAFDPTNLLFSSLSACSWNKKIAREDPPTRNVNFFFEARNGGRRVRLLNWRKLLIHLGNRTVIQLLQRARTLRNSVICVQPSYKSH